MLASSSAPTSETGWTLSSMQIRPIPWMLTLPPMRELPDDTVRALYQLMAYIEIRKSFY